MKSASILNRREFVRNIAAVAAGAAISPLAQVSAWAAPVINKPIELKLRQNLIYDGMFDLTLRPLNSRAKNLNITSSYIDSDRGWAYEREHTDEVPFWYTEGEQCDIFMARGPALAQLADAGLIVPLDDFLKESDMLDRDDFHSSRYGSVLDSATYRDSLWAIPVIGDPYALFCNMDLFRAAGVEKPPVTWKETIEAAGRLTRDTDGDGKPDVFGYSQCSFQFPLQILTAGLRELDLEKKISTFDTEAAVEALDIYRHTKQYSPPHVDFEKGDMAMKISVMTNSFGRYDHLDYITTRLPEGKRRANTYGDSDGITAFAISSKVPQERRLAAWKAIEYLTSEFMFFKMVETGRMLPLRKSILEGERYAKYIEKFPQVKAFVGELEWAVPKPCIPEYRFIEVVMREILYPVQREGAMDLTREDLRKHLEEQAARVNEKLAKSTW